MIHGIAFWLITRDKQVLLQRKKESRWPSLYQPIVKGQVRSNEMTTDAVIRNTREELGQGFTNRYPFHQLSKIGETRYLIEGKEAVRHHFLGLMTNQQLSLINSPLGGLFLTFIDREKLPEIKRFSDSTNPTKFIVLFDEDYKILHEILQSSGE